MTESFYIPICIICLIIFLIVLFYFLNNNIKQIYNKANSKLDNYIENFIT